MRPALASLPAAALLVALSLGGCFALNDTGDFEVDEGCDLQLELRDFAPHVRDRFEVRLVQPRANPDALAELQALALFEPLDSPFLSLRMPNAVAPLEDASRPRSAIDFYADFDSEPGFSFPGDHTWILPDACAEGPEEFVHNVDFEPVRDIQPRDAGVRVVLCQRQMEAGNAPIEVRVTGNFPPDVNRAVGFFRRATARDGAASITIPGIVDLGFRHEIEVYVDVNENEAHDSGEPTWSFRYRPEDMRECDFDSPLPEDMLLCVTSAGLAEQPMRIQDALGSLETCIDDAGNVAVTLGDLGNRQMTGSVLPPASWFSTQP